MRTHARTHAHTHIYINTLLVSPDDSSPGHNLGIIEEGGFGSEGEGHMAGQGGCGPEGEGHTAGQGRCGPEGEGHMVGHARGFVAEPQLYSNQVAMEGKDEGKAA